LQKRGELRTHSEILKNVPTPKDILANKFFDKYRISTQPTGDDITAFYDADLVVPGM
jgi:hypothetical protein